MTKIVYNTIKINKKLKFKYLIIPNSIIIQIHIFLNFTLSGTYQFSNILFVFNQSVPFRGDPLITLHTRGWMGS